MKISKKKAQESLKKRLAEHERERSAGYRKYMHDAVSNAEVGLKHALNEVARKEQELAQAKANLAKFKTDKDKEKYIPQYIQNRLKLDELTADRILRVQRKIALVQGDTINVTDGEMLVL